VRDVGGWRENGMIPMRLREMTSCPEHQQAIIVLEDLTGHRTLAVAADPDESRRLAREVARRPDDAHLIYDFVDGLLGACGAKPTRVVLECSPGVGLGATVTLSRSDGDVVVPCYLADGLALAHRAEIPIFVSTSVFSNVEASPLSPAPVTDDAPAEVTQWLERIRPSDFSTH